MTCSELYSVKLSYEHNNTNVLVFGSRVVGVELVKMIVEQWLIGEYQEDSHQRRLDMIHDIEEKNS